MRQLLDFDDAGADDNETVKGVTVGDIRAWHDQYDNVLSTWAECRQMLADERRNNAKLIEALRAVRKYYECGMSVMMAAEILDSIAD